MAEDVLNKETSQVVETEGEDIENRIYEIGYLLVPTIASDKINEESDKLKKVLSIFKVRLISDELPRLISLAYEMEKTIGNKKQRFNKAYFGWIKFELDSPSLLKLKEELDKDDNLIRFMIIKVSREVFIPAKKRSLDKRAAPKKTEAKKETKPLSETEKVEIDKKIEELVS